MNEKLLSPILKEREKRLAALHAKLRAAEQEASDCNRMIDMTNELPTMLEVGTRLRIRNLREPLGPELENYREKIVEITKFEPSWGANGRVHFSYLGMQVPEALDLAWFEEP